MSRLRKALRTRLGGLALTALIAWALARPVLHAADLLAEEGMAMLYALLAALLIYGVSLARRRLAPLIAALLLGGLVLLALAVPGSLPSRALWAGRAFFSGAPPRDVMLAYQDALLPLLLLLLAFYARLLMEGDPAFSLPLLVTPVLMLWFVGVKAQVSLYLPAMLCLPLLYGYVSREEDGKPAAPRRLMGFRVLIVALAVTLLAYALTPSLPQTQPQAAQMASDLRRAIEDYFFFTQTRNSFSLASQGFQPMGEDGLGGSPTLSRAPVMVVEAPETVYLRGTALDLYNGRAWYDTLSHQRYGWQSMRFAGLKAELFNEKLPQSDRLEQKSARVSLLSAMPSTLFVPQRIRELQPGTGMVPYFNASTEVFTTRDLAGGDSYAVRYEPYHAGQARTDALVNLLAQTGDSQLPQLAPEYYQLPEHLKPDGMVAELARQAAGAETTPYRQGLALMRYLKSSYRYSLQVPDAPRDVDFVSHFLFSQKSGYCTYFASAMTVMARSLGLPARYVEGFLAKPGEAGKITLTGEDGHSWAEIYIAGLGWTVFDATPWDEGSDNDGGQPPSPEQPPSPPSPSPSPTPSPEPQSENTPEPSPAPRPTPSLPPEEQPPEPSGQPSPQPDQDRQSPPGPPFPWWWLLMLMVLAVLIWAVREGQPRRAERRMKDKAQVMGLYWTSLLQVNRTRGLGMEASETPLAYAARLPQAQPEAQGQKSAGDGFVRLAGAYNACAYGRQRPGQAAVDLAREQFLLAYGQLSWHRKARMALRWGARFIASKLSGFVPAIPGRLKNRPGKKSAIPIADKAKRKKNTRDK